MSYKCLKCEEEIEEDDLRRRIRCPYCGYRILKKKRMEAVKEVKAR
ncbi:MAG: DNA-directed RNA polymerase subunit P [Candidatus Aenigmatarchaeota archaeon]